MDRLNQLELAVFCLFVLLYFRFSNYPFFDYLAITKAVAEGLCRVLKTFAFFCFCISFSNMYAKKKKKKNLRAKTGLTYAICTVK